MNRCNECLRKLNLAEVTIGKCKCGHIGCARHRINHNCTYDYQEEGRKKIHNDLVNYEPKTYFGAPESRGGCR